METFAFIVGITNMMVGIAIAYESHRHGRDASLTFGAVRNCLDVLQYTNCDAYLCDAISGTMRTLSCPTCLLLLLRLLLQSNAMQ